MSTQTKEKTKKPGLVGSIIDMGAATTNLAIDQFGNAMTALIHPGAAIDHVRDTFENLSSAMNTSAATNAMPHVEEPKKRAHAHKARKAHKTKSRVTAKARHTKTRVKARAAKAHAK